MKRKRKSEIYCPSNSTFSKSYLFSSPVVLKRPTEMESSKSKVPKTPFPPREVKAAERSFITWRGPWDRWWWRSCEDIIIILWTFLPNWSSSNEEITRPDRRSDDTSPGESWRAIVQGHFRYYGIKVMAYTYPFFNIPFVFYMIRSIKTLIWRPKSRFDMVLLCLIIQKIPFLNMF